MNPPWTLNRWLRTRDFRRLRLGIPAILACVAWLAFAICLLLWTPRWAESGYGGIADKAMARRDFETARVASQRLLAIGHEPRRKHLFDLALCLGGMGRDKDAVSLLGTVAPLDRPGYLPGHLFIAQTLLSKTNVTLHEIGTAEQHLKYVIALAPHSPDANELLGRIYVRLGRWELAEKYLSEVVSARPQSALLLAAALRAQGDTVGARSYAERAVRFHREKVEAAKLDLPASRLAWADALAMADDYRAAFIVLEAGWKQYENKTYLSPMGEVCALWVEELARSQPRDLATQIGLIQRGLEYAPQNEILLRRLIALSHLEGPEAGAARATITRMLAGGNAPAILHFTLGTDAWQQGQTEEARKHFALAFDSASQLPFVANNMAMILAVGDKPDLPRALALIQPVLERFPANPNFRETRGQILVRLGRWQEAVADLEFALPRLSSTRSTHSALADAYRGMGLRELAREHERLAKGPSEEKPSTPPSAARK
jgi:tetratricopeptide (TPR) repeat protein